MDRVTSIDFAITLWIVVAVAVTVYMVRRGHRPSRWAGLAFLLGPFAIVPATWARIRAGGVRAKTLQKGVSDPGGLAVLVGIDGSNEARRALIHALDQLGGTIGRLTLASVLDFETATGRSVEGDREQAARSLDEAARLVRDRSEIEPTTVLLAGLPAEALLVRAREHGDDLIVVGSHVPEEPDWLLGDTAAALSSQDSVPVMVIPGDDTGSVDRPES